MSTLSVSATLLSVHIHTAAAYPQYITCTQLLYNCSFHMNFTMFINLLLLSTFVQKLNIQPRAKRLIVGMWLHFAIFQNLHYFR